MSKNGGFPPIKYKIKEKEKTIDNFNKDRLNAPNINKHLDIKKILSQSKKKQMIYLNVNRIDIINSL